MRSLIIESPFVESPDLLLPALRPGTGLVLLCSGLGVGPHARYSFLAARPFLIFQSRGSRCDTWTARGQATWFGNPWHILDQLINRYEVPNEIDQPFPLGGCFGFWGYDLRHHLEPRLHRSPSPDSGLPDSHLGFYDSLVVFDHVLGRTWIVATGLQVDGSRSLEAAHRQAGFWTQTLAGRTPPPRPPPPVGGTINPVSNLDRPAFLAAVRRAQEYIRAGDIYQVNLARRLQLPCAAHGADLFRQLLAVSPAPFAAYLDAGDFQLASSSPELFLRLSGRQVLTRPIKGTRRRDADPHRDAQLAYELQTHPKELAELLMITDLLRNDLGRISEFGTVLVPDLARLERYPQVQHLVATVEGRLRPEFTHLRALASCFPGGSVTGAPKIRAMEIIDQLEPIGRGPYTGALGYLGFNGESQLSIIIRTALVMHGQASFHTGAGIVADSDPEAEYAETEAKAGGFLRAAAGLPEESGLRPDFTSSCLTERPRSLFP